MFRPIVPDAASFQKVETKRNSCSRPFFSMRYVLLKHGVHIIAVAISTTIAIVAWSMIAPEKEALLNKNKITYKYSFHTSTNFCQSDSCVHQKMLSINLTHPKTGEGIPDSNFISPENLKLFFEVLSVSNKPLLLTISNYEINAEIISMLEAIPNVQSLIFCSCNINECSLDRIQSMPHHFRLGLVGCKSNRSWDNVFGKINNLTELRIIDTPLSDTEWTSLASCNLQINVLYIANPCFTSSTCHFIVSTKSIDHLSLTNMLLCENDIETINTNLSLQTFDLTSCTVRPCHPGARTGRSDATTTDER